MVLLDFTGFYWVLLSFQGFSWVLLSFQGFSWDLLSFQVFFLGFPGCSWVFLGCTWLYWVSLIQSLVVVRREPIGAQIEAPLRRGPMAGHESRRAPSTRHGRYATRWPPRANHRFRNRFPRLVSNIARLSIGSYFQQSAFFPSWYFRFTSKFPINTGRSNDRL